MTSTGFIIDATIHAYNLLPSNARSPAAQSMGAALYDMVVGTGDAELVPADAYNRDWSIGDLAHTVFVESEVDLAVYHGVPLDDYFYDGLSSNDKGVEMSRRWPDRVLFYAAVNPLEGTAALEKAEHYVKDCGAVGIKLYPERYVAGSPVTPVRLDAPGVTPLLEKIIELDVPVAIHKFVPGGHGSVDNYRIGDVEAAAARYPELTIEVVHSGAAFIEETKFLLKRYGNVWANLEVTCALAVSARRRFAHALGTLMSGGGADRLLFSSGCSLTHPQPQIEALRAFTMPDDLMDEYGYPEVTPSVIDGMLGGNYLRMHGIDRAAAQAAIDGDEFARDRAAYIGPRWSRHGSWLAG